jgi:hypothetical protein
MDRDRAETLRCRRETARDLAVMASAKFQDRLRQVGG